MKMKPAEKKASDFLSKFTSDRGPVFRQALRRLTRHTERLEAMGRR